ncbi:hypothetical protein A2841_00160 [Candidatus Kaiserbacteria bacterium RIFCSPHIGHO2_01_FULL_48_10]|uniref:Nucleotidyl transferase AbiEii/AbiGii toxin family protein n=1 Tax=Candidatus Kaiserbacteria bacterium RIFCSPHIGHO2_01_FULL_48_10 TaxID=1798476 RepID=A0A1F6C5P3_9BACT|nr:MAG: hypothetical protein A2841_00160 [Candidatus Kaiserbacteria bacterium RIFCSPHIGHO2_01_FULL_48_10]
MAKEILTKRQIFLLRLIAKDKFLQKHFYLTGGTALAGLYLHHRLSEDLDFFSEQEFDVSAVTVFFQKNKQNIRFTKIDFQQSYNRNLFFLHFKDEIVKTEFTYYPFPRIDATKKEMGLSIDSILDIAVNKLFTIYQQTNARHYIDLYCIIQKYGWSIDGLVKKAKAKFDWHIDPLQLGTQFIKVKTAKDFPNMIEKIPPQEWRDFFIHEAEKLKNQVIK